MKNEVGPYVEQAVLFCVSFSVLLTHTLLQPKFMVLGVHQLSGRLLKPPSPPFFFSLSFFWSVGKIKPLPATYSFFFLIPSVL